MTEQKEPKRMDIKEAIAYLALHALRAPITPAEHQTITQLRDQLIALASPPKAE
jgi:hypothetical protein